MALHTIDDQTKAIIREVKTTGEPTMVFPKFACEGEPAKYQVVGAQVAYLAKRFLLLDPMGLGKTIQAILLILKLFQDQKEGRRKSARVLIAVEADTLRQWVGELKKFADVDAIVPHGDKKARLHKYENASSRDCCVVLVNHSKLIHDIDNILWGVMPDAFIVDEASILTNPNETSRHAKWVARSDKGRPEFVLYMTGEAMTRGELVQLYNLLDVLHVNPFEPMQKKQFVATYQKVEKKKVTVHGPNGAKTREVKKLVGVNTSMLPDFKERIFHNVIRRPESITVQAFGARAMINRQLITVEMTPFQRQRYDEVKAKVLSQGGVVKQIEALTLATYLSQVLNSPWIVDKHAPRDYPKGEAVARLIKHRLGGEKLVLFAGWKDAHILLTDIFHHYGIQAVFYSGDLDSEKERPEVIRRFNEEPEVAVLVMTKAGRKGLNLQVAHNVGLLDMLYTPSDVRQIIGRVDRIGQNSKIINVFFFVAEGSTEMQIFDVLGKRQSIVDAVFDESKAELFDKNFKPEETLLRF